jgi:hypothetical protein
MRINELDRVQQRITKYKEEELALFNRKVKDIIESAAQEVLGQALSSHEQEILISKALDKARQEGVI